MTSDKYQAVLSNCLHPPTPDLGRHVCINRSSLWLQSPDGQWWGLGLRSIVKTNEILSLCQSWEDVLVMRDELGLVEP